MSEIVARIRGKGEMTIPVEIRKITGLDIGDFLIVTTKNNDIILRKAELK